MITLKTPKFQIGGLTELPICTSYSKEQCRLYSMQMAKFVLDMSRINDICDDPAANTLLIEYSGRVEDAFFKQIQRLKADYETKISERFGQIKFPILREERTKRFNEFLGTAIDTINSMNTGMYGQNELLVHVMKKFGDYTAAVRDKNVRQFQIVAETLASIEKKWEIFKGEAASLKNKTPEELFQALLEKYNFNLDGLVKEIILVFDPKLEVQKYEWSSQDNQKLLAKVAAFRKSFLEKISHMPDSEEIEKYRTCTKMIFDIFVTPPELKYTRNEYFSVMKTKEALQKQYNHPLFNYAFAKESKEANEITEIYTKMMAICNNFNEDAYRYFRKFVLEWFPEQHFLKCDSSKNTSVALVVNKAVMEINKFDFAMSTQSFIMKRLVTNYGELFRYNEHFVKELQTICENLLMQQSQVIMANHRQLHESHLLNLDWEEIEMTVGKKVVEAFADLGTEVHLSKHVYHTVHNENVDKQSKRIIYDSCLEFVKVEPFVFSNYLQSENIEEIIETLIRRISDMEKKRFTPNYPTRIARHFYDEETWP